MSRSRSVPPLAIVAAIVAVVVAVIVVDSVSSRDERRELRAEQQTPSASATPNPSPSPSPRSTALPANEAGQLDGVTSHHNFKLSRCTPGAGELARCGKAPRFRDISTWLNTPGGEPVPASALRHNVVLVDFWSTACMSCVRDQRYVTALDDTYRGYGLRVIGVQSPQFGFERSAATVRAAMKRLGIRYPVALDPQLHTWSDYRNRYWPAKYLIDRKGVVRAISFGEGDTARFENLIRAVLVEDRGDGARLPEPSSPNVVLPRGERPKFDGVTPEMYLGYSRATAYEGTPALTPGADEDYSPPADRADDRFSFGGGWRVGTQSSRAGANATLEVSAKTSRAYLVTTGSGTITVREDGQPDQRIEIDGPGVHQILDGDEVGRHDLDLALTPGLRVYSLSFA